MAASPSRRAQPPQNLSPSASPADPFDLFSTEELSEKHWRILEAALRVFSEKGYSASRTNEIAKEAGVSEGTIFHYFKTKKELLTGLLLPLFSRFFRPLVAQSAEEILRSRQKQSIEEVLFSLMQDRIHLVQNHLPLIKTIAAEAAFHPELLEPLRDKVIPYMVQLGRQFFEEEKKRGTLRPVSVDTALRTLISMILGYVLARNAFPDLFSWEEEEIEIRRMLDLYLHGVSAERNDRKENNRREREHA